MRTEALLGTIFLLVLVHHIQCTEAQNPSVLDVLLAMTNVNSAAISRGAGNMLNAIQAPQPTSVVLPQCKQTNVLLNAGKFPANWAQLTAEQQALHPINLVMMQLAYAVYQPADTFRSCLYAMGITPNSIKTIQKTVPEYQSERTAMVMRAGNDRIFILIKGSDVTYSDGTLNMGCRHVKPDPQLFGGKDIGLHRGFWLTWQALESDILAAVRSYLTSTSGEVYIIGHSLGAAVSSIAALRLNTALAGSRGKVAGVWLLACPRAGNAAFANAYNSVLKQKTMRFSNNQDFAVRVPDVTQRCPVGAGINSGVLNALYSETAVFTFAHVGRSVLMCPDTATGLTQWRIAADGSESPDCGPGQDEVDASAVTHQLGSYFDAWRRGYLASKGTDLRQDPHVMAVLCQACTFRATSKLAQVAVPARPGGPVTCAVDASCSQQRAFDAATAVQNQLTTQFVSQSECQGFMCTQ